jgi:hypothetical protein
MSLRTAQPMWCTRLKLIALRVNQFVRIGNARRERNHQLDVEFIALMFRLETDRPKMMKGVGLNE